MKNILLKLSIIWLLILICLISVTSFFYYYQSKDYRVEYSLVGIFFAWSFLSGFLAITTFPISVILSMANLITGMINFYKKNVSRKSAMLKLVIGLIIIFVSIVFLYINMTIFTN